MTQPNARFDDELNFDAETVDPTSPFDELPPGDYLVYIIEATREPTKAGTGSYLKLVLRVLDGPFEGRLIWDRLNLWNPSEQAKGIAQRTLSAICHATGLLKLARISDLLGTRAMVVTLKLDKAGERTEVKRYAAVDDSTTRRPTTQPARASAVTAPDITPAAAPATPAAPWLKKRT